MVERGSLLNVITNVSPTLLKAVILPIANLNEDLHSCRARRSYSNLGDPGAADHFRQEDRPKAGNSWSALQGRDGKGQLG